MSWPTRVSTARAEKRLLARTHRAGRKRSRGCTGFRTVRRGIRGATGCCDVDYRTGKWAQPADSRRSDRAGRVETHDLLPNSRRSSRDLADARRITTCLVDVDRAPASRGATPASTGGACVKTGLEAEALAFQVQALARDAECFRGRVDLAIAGSQRDLDHLSLECRHSAVEAIGE